MLLFLFLLLSKYEIEATQSKAAAVCRVGFLHRGEKKSTQCAIGNPEGPQERNNEMGKEGGGGEQKKSAFFDMQLF